MATYVPPVGLEQASTPPLEFVPVTPDPDAFAVSDKGRAKLAIDVIHDGWFLPPEFAVDGGRQPLDLSNLPSIFRHERDWGASVVAGLIASQLQIDGFHRVQVARALLDFGRFPGSSDDNTDLVHRLAINEPFASLLGWDQKRQLLEQVYDRISQGMDGAISGKNLKIAVHTYDEHNRTQTRRPEVSLLTRSHGHQRDFAVPPGLFDPSFPAELLDSTADRLLTARLALSLEQAGIYVAENYPYALPEGSVEIRAQVWSFFDWLRRNYDDTFPLAPKRAADLNNPRAMVWRMLLDTNLRSSESELLRSVLHHYRRPPVGQEALFGQARIEYEQIREYIAADKADVLRRYRLEARMSSLGVEVRKDLVWDFERDEPRWDEARRITRPIAQAIAEHLANVDGQTAD